MDHLLNLVMVGFPVWTELNFYEDITPTVVHGDLTIQEGVGLIESVPLLGEEILEVIYQSEQPHHQLVLKIIIYHQLQKKKKIQLFIILESIRLIHQKIK